MFLIVPLLRAALFFARSADVNVGLLSKINTDVEYFNDPDTPNPGGPAAWYPWAPNAWNVEGSF